jgi:hypothetical protein
MKTDLDPDTLRSAPFIGITGKAGAGKTLAARWFLRNHTQVVKLAFAKSLKTMIYELIRESIPKTWPHKAGDYIDDPILKETPIPFLGNQTSRHLMQTLGTEWGRQTIHPDFWVGIAAAKIERLVASGFKSGKNYALLAIFDDLRFANEADMVRAYDGVILRIERPDANKPAAIAGHASEELDFPADITLVNDGTPDDLHEKLAEIWPPTIRKKD